MKKEIIQGGIIEEFINWFYARGEFYKKLPVKYYTDGEPYFSSQGEECNLRDYLRVKNESRCKRCGETKIDAEKYISPCCNFEKVYTKHLFNRL